MDEELARTLALRNVARLELAWSAFWLIAFVALMLWAMS